MGEPAQARTSSLAPYHNLSKHPYTSIEYPGPVSEPAAILNYASQDTINACFNAPAAARANLQVRFRGDQPGPPLRGHRTQSQKLLLRVVKRRHRKPQGSQDVQGVFMIQIAGVVNYTVRFVSMADYHWTPDPNGHTASLLSALKRLDYNAILDYTFPPLDEEFVEPNSNSLDPHVEYRSKLDLQPPPIFTTRQLPFAYNFKMPPQATPEQVPHPITGRLRTRYVNKARISGISPQTLQHDHSPSDVPTAPTAIIKDKLGQLRPELLQKLRDKFLERPVWTKHSLLAQFSPEQAREIRRNKVYITAVAYVMTTGVFWNCHVRLGYDPVADPEARRYQRVFFYPQKKTVKNPINVKSDDEEEERVKGWWNAEQERLISQGKRPALDSKKAHIFDGQYLNREQSDFQLCDVVDPFIFRYINDTEHLSRMCTVKSGWYMPTWATLIKSLIRTKFVHMWETGTPAPDDLCLPVIEEYQRGLLNSDDEDDKDAQEDMDVDEEEDEQVQETQENATEMDEDD
ncbi:uncharacterized protein L203_101950 [Cryptococcus depauperatus CBS 7841]|uniref:Uncharacterized protein n=1 Tax=Cryptococcus depauperatus CBS 7841 TaxID=1295531 RepID=A0A1E3IHB7_9TREE|nr:hypothetical protein L203_03199 [Cryptococcus depauperatus CBS 7841]